MNAQSVIKKSVLVILPANNFNETEYLTVKNNLERRGINIFIASDANAAAVGSLGLKVKAEVSFFNLNERNFAGIIFLGGNGVKNYWDNQTLHRAALKFFRNNKTVSAICSAVVILARAGLLKDQNAACFPESKKEIEKEGAIFVDSCVVKSGNIITAQGPSSASEFADAVYNSIL